MPPLSGIVQLIIAFCVLIATVTVGADGVVAALIIVMLE